MANQTYKVPAENLSTLTERIEKLNKKVEKLNKKGFPAAPVTITVHPLPVIETVEKLNQITGEKYTVEKVSFMVEIGGEPVKASGWEFIGTLQHEEGGTIVRAIPGSTQEGELAEYRDAKPECHHCGFNRRRNDTFIVRNSETGEHKQVGRNCLADFFGFDPHGYAASAEIYVAAGLFASAAEEEGFGGSGERSRWYITIAQFLPYVNAVIRKNGWLSRGKAWAMYNDKSHATSSIAFHDYLDHAEFKAGRKPSYFGVIPEAQDEAVAKKTIEFCAEYFDKADPAKLSDYEHNLRVAMFGAVCDFRLAGIVASAINFAAKQIESKVERVDFSNSIHVGTIGKRQIFHNIKCIYPGFGGRPVVFADLDGNKITAWNTEFPVEKGQVYTVKATPKKHDSYKEVKSTMVNRVVLATEKDLAPKKSRAKKVAPVVEAAAKNPEVA